MRSSRARVSKTNIVSGTLAAECAANTGGYSYVIGGGQFYATEKSEDELNHGPSCDASLSLPPSNEDVGTCVETLRSGLISPQRVMETASPPRLLRTVAFATARHHWCMTRRAVQRVTLVTPY